MDFFFSFNLESQARGRLGPEGTKGVRKNGALLSGDERETARYTLIMRFLEQPELHEEGAS